MTQGMPVRCNFWFLTYFCLDVVLNSYKKGDSDALSHDVHIWIGSESSQDEYGTAAYKEVELDDYLGGKIILAP